MHTGNIIPIIIGIMYINHIRPAIFKLIRLPVNHFYPFRIFKSFIVHLPKRAVRIHVKIRNRHTICVALRVFPRRKIHTLKAVPHRRFIREKCYFFSDCYLIFHRVLNLHQQLRKPPAYFIYIVSHVLDCLRYTEQLFTIFFHTRNGRMSFAFPLFNGFP